MVQLAITGPGQPVPDDLAAGGLQGGGAGVGGEMVLAREPTDVADLAEEVAASTGPTPNS